MHPKGQYLCKFQIHFTRTAVSIKVVIYLNEYKTVQVTSMSVEQCMGRCAYSQPHQFYGIQMQEEKIIEKRNNDIESRY